MKRISTCIFILCFCSLVVAQEKRSLITTTPDYATIITSYKEAIKSNPHFKWIEGGATDIGKYLNLLVISKNKNFDPVSLRKQGKAILFINNGIHPGEPEGIDACIELVRAFSKYPNRIPDNVVICIMPVYNIDGCLNRGTSRVNQNGPVEYGFRGNAKNLDLNRDFIKCDAENTKSFIKLFREWDPDVFLDTHTSNGADYQHVLTLLATLQDKLQPTLGKYMNEQLIPALYKSMEEKNYDLSPYVDPIEETPESGLVGFMDSPRYSTGYSTLFNTFGFVTETHMWKPYNDRVWATYDFIHSLIDLVNLNAKEIISVRKQSVNAVKEQINFTLNWKLDTSKAELITFKGYEAKYKRSTVTGLQRLYYDRNMPFTKPIKFYNHYNGTQAVNKPAYYLVPQAWQDVVERLKLNNVSMKRLSKDTVLTAEVYYIADYKTSTSPYEQHYIHRNIQVRSENQTLPFYKGDYLIETNQAVNRYIVETLEPQGPDSFFAWGFFDAILQQKEYFSHYIFVEKAEEILAQQPELKKQLSEKQQQDTAFAKNNWDQLSFIYQHSSYYERSHKRYPVARLNAFTKLPVE